MQSFKFMSDFCITYTQTFNGVLKKCIHISRAVTYVLLFEAEFELR